MYNDLSYYGSDEDKEILTFMMLDREGRQEVNMQVYEDFWIGFMYMYGEILHVNMSYSKESK